MIPTPLARATPAVAVPAPTTPTPSAPPGAPEPHAATAPPAPVPMMPSLAEALRAVPEPRGAQGLLHPLVPLLLSVIYAMFCGKSHPAAIAEWVDTHYEPWLRDTLGFPQPSRPCRTTFYLFLGRLDWRCLEQALRGWIESAAAHAGLQLAEEPVALDGKEVRGVRKVSASALVLVSAFTHQSGLTVALRSCGAGQEIVAVQALLSELTLTGRIVTLDALHTQPQTARQIIGSGGDYVLTVKGNQPGLLESVQTVFAPGARTQHPDWDWQESEQYGSGHGRQECRRLVAVSVDSEPLGWPGAAQVFCLTRSVLRRQPAKPPREAAARAEQATGDAYHYSFEVVYGITSLSREQADAGRLLQLNRGHWSIENRSHWVRDVVCGEDRGQTLVENTPEVLAVIRTAAISALRLHQVRNLAAAFRRNGDEPRRVARFLGLSIAEPVL